MTGLKKRIITALLFVAVVFGCLFGGPYTFSLLFGAITILCMWEFFSHILEDSNPVTHNIRKFMGILLGLVPFEIASYCLYFDIPAANYLAPALLVTVPIFFLAFIFELFTKTERPFANIGSILLGVAYIGVPFAMLDLIAFRNGSYSPNVIFSMLIMVWANDTFAYFTGSWFGKHKLFPRISPKKTWEGSFGGFFGTLLTAVICHFLFPNEGLLLQNWLILGIIIAIFGSLGDLVESMLKRSLKIKDTGNLLPGHGGFLDRFDAFIFLIPFVALYLWYCG